MPEYPDIIIYIERLDAKLKGEILENIQLLNPFLLRTFDPSIDSIFSKRIIGFLRIGKRIVFELENEYFLVLHLMIAGRLRWKPTSFKATRKSASAVFVFAKGKLVLTEAGTKKRASLHLIKGKEMVQNFNSGGLEIFGSTLEEFKEKLLIENHTLKRSLTDPRLFSGIGNAYSDEILHSANLSPILQTQKMNNGQIEKLFSVTQKVLLIWAQKFREEIGDGFPDKVTAFREDMAVHGKFGKPCPVCTTTVQRIRYAANETNYCPTCQTGGKVLADRSLSRLLKNDWPRTVEELEELKKEKVNNE
jgi:formamidopyrimidine-DNA glycosylase